MLFLGQLFVIVQLYLIWRKVSVTFVSGKYFEFIKKKKKRAHYWRENILSLTV